MCIYILVWFWVRVGSDHTSVELGWRICLRLSTVVHTSTTPAVPTLASPLYQHLWMDYMSNDTQLWCSSITCRVHLFCFVLLSGGAKSLLCAFCGVVMCAHVSQQAAVPPHPTSLYLHCQTHTACHICQTRKSLCICPNPVRPYTVCSLKWRGLGPGISMHNNLHTKRTTACAHTLLLAHGSLALPQLASTRMHNDFVKHMVWLWLLTASAGSASCPRTFC